MASVHSAMKKSRGFGGRVELKYNDVENISIRR